MLRLVLGAPGPSTQTGLEEVIRKYNTSKDAKTLNLHFSGNDILELESCLKGEHQELYEEIKEQTNKYKKVIIEIDDFVETRDCGKKDLFKNIVELFRPAGLSIHSSILTNEDIEDIVLNENMEMFRLNGSNITNMDRLFRKEKNTELVEVNISNNGLESFPVGLLCAPALKKLDISRNINVFSTWNDLMGKEYYGFEDGCNNINEADKDKLSGFFEMLFPNLTDLNVSDTGLSLSQVVQMPSLSKLKKLDISWNLFLFKNKREKDISQFFSLLSNLTDLDMHRTGLSQTIPIPLSKLEKLDISDNLGLFKNKSKEDISKFFSKFENLTDLNVSHTELSKAVQIPLSKLKKLDISWNLGLFKYKSKRVISQFFNQLSKLTDLNVSDTGLSLSQTVQIPLSKLERLDISDNSDLFEGKSEDDISQFFSKFENLTDLNVSDTGLSLSQTVQIPSLSKLEKLDISYNSDLFEGKSKEDISQFFSKFENLTDLNVSHTELSKAVQIPLKKIKRLDISYSSELEEIRHTEDNPGFFERLEELNVSGCRKLRIGNKFIGKLGSVKYLNICGVPLEDDYTEYTEDSNFHGTLLILKKSPSIGFLDKGGNIDFSLFKGFPGDGYSRIYGLKRLRVLCIEKDKIYYSNLLRKDIGIADSRDYYLELVREDRRKRGRLE